MKDEIRWSDRLELVAAWFEIIYPHWAKKMGSNDSGTEVQDELREIAKYLREQGK